MSVLHQKQPVLKSNRLQLHTKREYPDRRRPSTPGSPEDLASLSLLPPNFLSRFEAFTEQTKFDLEKLQEKLYNLPQELYDQILGFALICNAGNETFPNATKKGSPIINAQFIDGSYRPPVQLALNRKIRQETLQDYYRRTTFIFSDHSVMIRWLHSLCKEALAEIRQVRVMEATASCIFTGMYTRPDTSAGTPKGGANDWKTWNLGIETRQSSAGKSARAQEFATVASNWSGTDQRTTRSS